MGTRSLTRFIDAAKLEAGGSQPLLAVYRQFDGYPTAMGADLKKLLGKLKLVNGLGVKAGVANGMGCLAAQAIKGLKDEAGGVYVYPANTTPDDAGSEWVYTIYGSDAANDGAVMVRVEAGYGTKWKTVYDGPLAKLNPAAAEKKAE